MFSGKRKRSSQRFFFALSVGWKQTNWVCLLLIFSLFFFKKKQHTHYLFFLPCCRERPLTIFCSLFRERVITFFWLSYHHITYWKEWSMYKKKREEIGTKRIKVNSCLIFYCCCNMLIFPRIFIIKFQFHFRLFVGRLYIYEIWKKKEKKQQKI